MRQTYPWVGALLASGLVAGTVAADAPVTTVFFTTGIPPRALSCPAPVVVRRHMGDGEESFEGALLDCERQPRSEAVLAVSVLARPRGLPAPSAEALAAFDAGASPGFVAEGVHAIEPALLERLQRLADAFEGHAIEILSGYRPTAARTSRHHHGRALDLRVADVDREAVRDALVGLEGTGVGFYPQSTFVHVDVRERSTYWVDESGPGEPPRYVRGATPPGEEEGSVATELPEIDLDALRAGTEAAFSGITGTGTNP